MADKQWDWPDMDALVAEADAKNKAQEKYDAEMSIDAQAIQPATMDMIGLGAMAKAGLGKLIPNKTLLQFAKQDKAGLGAIQQGAYNAAVKAKAREQAAMQFRAQEAKRLGTIAQGSGQKYSQVNVPDRTEELAKFFGQKVNPIGLSQ